MYNNSNNKNGDKRNNQGNTFGSYKPTQKRDDDRSDKNRKNLSSDTRHSKNDRNSSSENREPRTFNRNANSNYKPVEKRADYRSGNSDRNSFSENREPRAFNRNTNSNYKPAEKRDDYRNDEADIFDDDSKNELIIGRNPVIEALKAERLIDTIYVNNENGGSIGLIISMAKEQGIVVKSVNDTKLSSMSNNASHQGVIAVGACAKYVTVEKILEIAKAKNEEPFIIICDEIEDPHNLGAIIRTAEAAGAHGIIIPKRRSASLNHTVFKTSAGAASWLPVARVSNIVASIEVLKKNGVWIYGTDSAGEDYTKTNLTGSIALVIGSEGSGIGRLVKEKCDFLLKLPMFGEITSLNASVAGGIFMYDIVRQRHISTK